MSKRLIPILSLFLLAAVCAPFAHAAGKVFADVGQVQAEFAKAIYRNPSEAELTVVVPKDMAAPPAAVVTVASPDEKEVWSGNFDLKPGVNACVLKNLDALAPGRYMANVRIGDISMKRMLRIERAPAIAAPDGPIKLRRILFTPDDYLFESFRDLEVRYSEPKFAEAYRSSRPEVLRVNASSFGRAVDGSYVIQGIEHPYRRGYLYHNDPIPFAVQSQSPEGPYVPVDAVPELQPQKEFFKSFHILGSAPGRRQYEMYDPAAHGTYTLRDIGVIQNMDPYDFGAVKAGYRTYWVVARTTSGTTVFLRKTPLFRDVPLFYGDNFDDGFTTNDNFGNSWLSDDGKTLFLARGQTVRRFAPYDVPYDLLPNSSRILTIYSTTDGVDWQYRHAISAGGPADHSFTQHYGGQICFMPEAGLYLAFINAYDSESQQVYLDLKYSRDGVHFHDFSDPKPFARTNNPDDWYFGELFPHTSFVQDGDRYYHILSGASLPHYIAEPLFRHDAASKITADDFKSIFGNRRMAESLPYFNSLGGWEGLARHGREVYCAVGTMSYRADGWFGVRAGDSEGAFVTRPIAGDGKLTVNASVADDGLLQIELIDARNTVLDTATITGDHISAPAFAMPAGDFRLRVTLRRADLYTLYIDR